MRPGVRTRDGGGSAGGSATVSGGDLSPASGNAVDLFRDRVARSGNGIALRTFPGGRTLRWKEWEARSLAFADRLVAEGVNPGDRVAIWAGNRPVWPIADLGALMAGAVPVGLYPSSAPSQVRALLSDAEVVAAVADLPERVRIFRELKGELPDLRLVLDEAGADPPEGAGRPASTAASLPGSEAAPDDDAILIYTSGSTGEPRGARISHRCLLASAASIQGALGLVEGDVTLSFLPFCHAGERVFGLYTRIHSGMEAVLVEDHRQVWEAARAVKPTLFGGLPRFYEKVYEALRAREEVGGDPRELIPAFFGTCLRLATSGGATLPAEVSRYLAALGVPVLGAYGLTEHLCASMNRPDLHDLETSGPPMPGTEIRIAEDGEILLRRTTLTFSGYLNRGEETRAAFTSDGEWLRTGDLGELDPNGFLRVTGRKKDLLALSTGKKVAPRPVEARLTEDPWISQAVLVGEGRKFVTALLALRREVVEAWARTEGLDGDWDTVRTDPRVRIRLDTVVTEVNRDLSRTESIRRYHLLPRELSQEEEELTPTLKVRRAFVVDRYRDEIEGMYRTRDGPKLAEEEA